MYTQKTRRFLFTSLFTLIILSVVPSVLAPPTPHSISGFIFESDGVTQVPLGTDYYINDTTSGDFIKGVTHFDFPGYTGFYFESVSGTDGDSVVVRSWNVSSYGELFLSLLGSLSNQDVVLNLSRGPEPTVNITSPGDDVLRNDSSPFVVSSTISLFGSDATNCSSSISYSNSSVLASFGGEPTSLNLGSLSRGFSQVIDWNVSGVGVGSSDVQVDFTCASPANVTFESLTNVDSITNVTIEDTTAPNITLFAPENNTWKNNTNISFQYSVADISELLNCSLIIDGSLLQTEVLPLTNTTLEFNETVSQGEHLWNITCYDNATVQHQGFSSTRNFSVDTIPPAITINTPLNNSEQENNSVAFTYTVVESGIGVDNCTVSINGTDYFTNYSIANNTNTTNIKYLSLGDYYWQVACFDVAGNFQQTSNTYFTVTDPDFVISTPKIFFNYSDLIEGLAYNVTANITNIGNQNGSNITVQFFLDDPDLGGTQIGSNHTINFIDISQEISLTQNSTFLRGENNIFVLVDPPIATNGSIEEANETNNKANNSLFISSWQEYLGNTTESTLLGTNSSLIISWNNNASLNMLFVEKDTVFEWTALQALGRNTTNGTASSDFTEADVELSLTNYSDSMYNLFTDLGVPKQVTSFTISGVLIENVPFINSSSNSTFITGVMWDKSDLGAEYNGSQDLIFVTLSENTSGVDPYDYQSSIPAKLRDYKLGSQSLDIYVEIA